MRNVRGDALAKYNSLNQSEPLRINLSLALAFTLFASPTIAPEVTAQSLSLAQTSVSVLAGLGATANFVRECQRRNRQLIRLEKELEALSLTVRLPQSLLSDQPYRNEAQTIMSVCRQGKRVVALYGKLEEIEITLRDLEVLGRRLTQAGVVVIPIPTDATKELSQRQPWLARAFRQEEWKSYFSATLDGFDDPKKRTDGTTKWFGLSSSGRSFGSGRDIASVSWIQLLGQHLRPMVVLDQADPNTDDKSGVLDQLKVFYSALTEGKLSKMPEIFVDLPDSSVSKVIQEGGRLDSWSTCLEDGNRPSGMKIADADVTLVSDTLAYSTCIEFPATIQDQQLLAKQVWKRESAQEPWKLALHQTIPWTETARAAGTLLCDGRGCVSLTRGGR